MSSAENENPAPDPADSSELSPLEGGRWRPVRPEELLKRNPADQTSALDPASDPAANSSSAPSPKVRLERRQELEHHLKSSPTDLLAFMELGRIYRAENRPIDARRVFHQALEVFPEEKELLWEHEEAVLARSLQQLKEVAELSARLDTIEAERELKRSRNDWACRRMDVCRARLARDPSLHHLRVVLAEAMTDAGMFEEAIDELNAALDNDDLSAAAFLLRLQTNDAGARAGAGRAAYCQDVSSFSRSSTWPRTTTCSIFRVSEMFFDGSPLTSRRSAVSPGWRDPNSFSRSRILAPL